jgi:hypothetical protein
LKQLYSAMRGRRAVTCSGVPGADAVNAEDADVQLMLSLPLAIHRRSAGSHPATPKVVRPAGSYPFSHGERAGLELRVGDARHLSRR